MTLVAAPSNDGNPWWQLNLFVILPVHIPTAGVLLLLFFKYQYIMLEDRYHIQNLTWLSLVSLGVLFFLQRNEKYWQDSKKSNVWNLLMNVLLCLFLALTICVFFSHPISGNQAAVFKLWMCSWKQGHTWGNQTCSVHVCVCVCVYVCVCV